MDKKLLRTNAADDADIQDKGMTPRERRSWRYTFELILWMFVAAILMAITYPIRWIFTKSEFNTMSNFMNEWSLKIERGLWRNRRQ